MRHALAIIFLTFAPVYAQAQVELSFYGGAQSAPASDVTITGTSFDTTFTQDWEGRSASAPPYYGLRATRWQSPELGFGVDFVHNKVYPKNDALPAGFQTLELTDGLNVLTVNAYRRWPDMVGPVSPYVGGGIGVAIPHVEVTNGASRTFGYQLTGPAATWLAGASYPVSDQWAIFGEYKGTFSANEASLDGGGTFQSDIVTNAVNVGVSFNF